MQVAPIFKGATRPACVFGVPIKPFVVVCGSFLLAGIWLWIPLMLGAPVMIFLMGRLAKEDDQIFDQIAINWRINHLKNSNRTLWQGVTSLASSNYKKEEL